MNLTNLGLDGEILLKAIGSLIAAIVAFIEIRKYFSTQRKQTILKNDLEILEMADKNRIDIDINIIKTRVKFELAKIYDPNYKIYKRERLVNSIVANILFWFFCYWAYVLYSQNDRFTWHMILPILAAMAGLLVQRIPSKKRDMEIKPIRGLSNFITALIGTIGVLIYSESLYENKGFHWGHLLLVPLSIYGFWRIMGGASFRPDPNKVDLLADPKGGQPDVEVA